jgi:hypothetical protein
MYSDLTIVCGANSYPVHRALLATRSSFFEGACRNSFKEAETGIINLSEDDIEAVEHMVHCKHDHNRTCIWTNSHALPDFYHMDYLNKPLSRRTSQRSSRASSPPSSRLSRRNPPKTLNMALVEDPLLATMSATNISMPLTPPADELDFQSLDASAKYPDTPMADESAFDELEGEQSAQELDVQNAHLVTHAKVYAIAEKYVCHSVIVHLPPLLSDYAPRSAARLPFARAYYACAAVRWWVTRQFNADKPRDLRLRRGNTNRSAETHGPQPDFHADSRCFSAFCMSNHCNLRQYSRLAAVGRSASAFDSTHSNHTISILHVPLNTHH